MDSIFDWLFSEYIGRDTHLIVLELVAAFFGVVSVVFSKRNSIWVFPTGIISTLISVYILAVYGLMGDMLINAYYFVMSIYGWYYWTRKPDNVHETPITFTTKKQKKKSIWIFLATMVFIALVYQVFDKWQNWYSYTDILTTAIFFVGQWLMSKRKVENWLYWIVGDSISVPLYFLKGLTFTALLYLAMTILAVFGYRSWKKIFNNNRQTV
jgi:nicotinamide mononucleotide transporter